MVEGAQDRRVEAGTGAQDQPVFPEEAGGDPLARPEADLVMARTSQDAGIGAAKRRRSPSSTWANQPFPKTSPPESPDSALRPCEVCPISKTSESLVPDTARLT
jgi:hypothetical protein